MDIKKMCDLIDENKDRLFTLLSNLIRINSENFGSYGNEQPCAEYVFNLCKELGLDTEMYSPLELEGFEQNPDYFPGRHLENRYNVTATWRGTEDCNRLMLMGHTDTVLIGDLANWDKDPLSGEISDGKIFGRGAGDDKYAVAVSLFIIQLLKEAGFQPKKNLLFSAYCDEELGGSHGAMAATMRYPCESIVNMDGAEKQIWHCASGGQVVTYRYRIKKGAADSAEKTARALPVVMDQIAVFGQRRREELEANPYYAGTIIPETSLRYNEIRAGNNDMDKHIGVLQFTFYTDKTKECIWEEFAQLDRVLQEKLEPLGMESLGFEPDTRFFHYGACAPDCKEILALVDAAKEATGEELLVCGSCLSDLSVILKYAAGEAMAFGAGREFNQPGGAHQPNEYIICDDLVRFTKQIAAYVLRCIG